MRMYGGDNMAIYINPTKESQPKLVITYDKSVVYKALEKFNRYTAVVAAAIVCPIVNTGVFLLGCLAFFMNTIREWGMAEGYTNVVGYMFLGLVGGNFLVELASNIILSPAIVKLLNIKKK